MCFIKRSFSVSVRSNLAFRKEWSIGETGENGMMEISRFKYRPRLPCEWARPFFENVFLPWHQSGRTPTDSMHSTCIAANGRLDKFRVKLHLYQIHGSVHDELGVRKTWYGDKWPRFYARISIVSIAIDLLALATFPTEQIGLVHTEVHAKRWHAFDGK